jgi:sulfite reductase alpha subunit-like flavoprotein
LLPILQEHATELYRLIVEKGGYVFVCGDGASMAADVQRCLLRILSEQGQQSDDLAEQQLKELARAGRYVRDIWS